MSRPTGRYAFTREQQVAILAEYYSDLRVTIRDLAAKYDCSVSTIGNVLRRARAYSEEAREEHAHRNEQRSREKRQRREKVAELRRQGLTHNKIGQRLGIAETTSCKWAKEAADHEI